MKYIVIPDKKYATYRMDLLDIAMTDFSVNHLLYLTLTVTFIVYYIKNYRSHE